LSDASRSLSDESNEDNEDNACEDQDSVENVGPETGVNEETYISVSTQELLPTSNGKDDRNPMTDFVDDMPDAAWSELTVHLEDVGG